MLVLLVTEEAQGPPALGKQFEPGDGVAQPYRKARGTLW